LVWDLPTCGINSLNVQQLTLYSTKPLHITSPDLSPVDAFRQSLSDKNISTGEGALLVEDEAKQKI